jgi:hypothetical protein
MIHHIGRLRYGMRRMVRPTKERKASGSMLLLHRDYNLLISRAAGRVYGLVEAGEPIFRSSSRDFIFFAALGWLLREDKVAVDVSDSGIGVRLK